MDYDPDCLMQRTLFEKIWDAHVVAQEPGAPAVLYIDLHLVHEVTSPQAFTGLRQRGLKVRRPDRTVATMDHSIPTTDRRAADPRRDGGQADSVSRRQLPGVRHSAARHALAAPRDRARHRAGARADPAGHDDRVRRQPHLDPRRVRRAGVRHRHERSRARAGDAVPAPAQGQDLRSPGGGPAWPGRVGEGHHPRDDREDRHRRRHRPRLRVHRSGDSRAHDGRAHDHLQHVHRGRGARGHDRARRHDVRVPRRPRVRAAGRGLGRGGGALAAVADRRGRDLRQDHHARRDGPGADDHLRHQPRHGHADHEPHSRSGRRSRT